MRIKSGNLINKYFYTFFGAVICISLYFSFIHHVYNFHHFRGSIRTRFDPKLAALERNVTILRFRRSERSRYMCNKLNLIILKTLRFIYKGGQTRSNFRTGRMQCPQKIRAYLPLWGKTLHEVALEYFLCP